MKTIVLFLIIHPFGLSSAYLETGPESFFDWFTNRIAYVETRNNHTMSGNVITNRLGMVGENQVSPITAEFIQRKYGYSCDIAILNCNRGTRDDYIKWMRSTGKGWVDIANSYNMGHNSKWVNTNYVTQVFGVDYFTNKIVMRAKKGHGNYYLVQFKERSNEKRVQRMRSRKKIRGLSRTN